MLFCQLGQAQSLREICGGLASCFGKLKHLGINSVPNRSTLSYANNKRPWQLYSTLFYQLLAKFQQEVLRKKKFRFKNKLYSLDSTVIELCATLFDWAKFRTTKGAVKLHLLLDHDGYMPVFAHVTEGKVHDVNIAREFSFPAGSIIVMDRAYVDYKLFKDWTEKGVYFVSRLKDNATCHVTEHKEVPDRSNILSDQLVVLCGQKANQLLMPPLCRIEVWDEENKQILVLLTNHPTFGATTIAKIYKDRWQIEILFKNIEKQNLKVKAFVGTSPNALLIQIWTASERM